MSTHMRTNNWNRIDKEEGGGGTDSADHHSGGDTHGHELLEE